MKKKKKGNAPAQAGGETVVYKHIGELEIVVDLAAEITPPDVDFLVREARSFYRLVDTWAIDSTFKEAAVMPANEHYEFKLELYDGKQIVSHLELLEVKPLIGMEQIESDVLPLGVHYAAGLWIRNVFPFLLERGLTKYEQIAGIAVV